ncbi:ImmA/IrrE family metallo-endopeptidase [Sellimonas intestinalis]|uniref:ImmA/IrrE family metallo-endopeptidase n=3 Tax=Sellimonas intestinalis TaxID=1653434 RepID=A0A3E3JY97_9FIRM|nr:ImmA/IrrE family metallo-endopeptidase [Sellimonas intestinalis]MTS25318.1 ImmA/IrrE family metallo-endopeptidase [Sellimonas intestinalis]NSJ25290.1 ImmA/IrrE family metallo-endopeptidase [Sellimonas intestinalis]NSK30646.1 ImmA/IrrE family metallo-endopeptidase [Sellimonas intestinalis]NSK47886.1 ImmA/IrrE family metallo-endopeptidase [Sellimonas intestinalis]NSK54458.1 ImmA/IrrE family metallo-endopeptidase [Sellimonas intestinalis]
MYLTYEELLIESESQNLIVKEKNLPGYNGRIYKNRIAISKNLNMSEKKCVLAEELGHHHTSVGNILNMEDLSNRKQERQARLWGYNKLIGLTGIVNAFESGCQSAYEASEFLEVTVEYLQECIDCYRDKYGICTEIGNYIIYFIPNLAVMEKV